MDTLDTLKEIKESAAAEVRAQLAKLDDEIKQTHDYVTGLRAERVEAARLMRALDPEFEKEKKEKEAKRKQTERQSGYVSEEIVEQVWAFLRTHMNGDTFTVTDVKKSEEYKSLVGRSEPSLRNAIGRLHERGNIALDHTDKQKGKHYKLVSS